MPTRNLATRLISTKTGLTFLQALQAFDPNVHIYTLDDPTWSVANAPWNEAGDTTQSDNTEDAIGGGDADEKIQTAGALHSSPAGSGFYLHMTEQDITPNNENRIWLGKFGAPVSAVTVGGWLQWEANHSTGPFGSGCMDVIFGNQASSNDLMHIRHQNALTNGTTVPYNTKLGVRTGSSGNTYDVTDMSASPNFFTMSTEDVGSGNYRHTITWNGSQIRQTTNTGLGVMASTIPEWQITVHLSEFSHAGKPVDLYAQDFFHMQGVAALTAAQALTLYNNFKL